MSISEQDIPDTSRAGDTPLGRMVAPARDPEGDARAARARALRHALRRMASDMPGMDLEIDAVRESIVSVSELLERAEPGMFLAMIEGPDDGLGVVMLESTVTAACIEVQTLGRVLPLNNASAPCRPTRTDAALIAPLIDTVLTGLAARQSPGDLGPWGAGYAYGSFLDDPRPLGGVLEETRYRLAEIDLQFGGVDRPGRWAIALPLPEKPPPAPGDKASDADPWAETLRGMVDSCPVTLEAVLYRLQMPLRDALDLTPGQVLRIPTWALESLDLQGIDGKLLGNGRLGQARGARALRLTSDLGVPASVSAAPDRPSLGDASAPGNQRTANTSVPGKAAPTTPAPASRPAQ